MLEPVDAIELAAGVRVVGAAVEDDVRGAVFPANETALLVLGRAGEPLGETARALARAHAIDVRRAGDDVLRFAHALNRELLANVRHGRSRARRCVTWLRLALRLAPAGLLPSGAARRYPLDTSSAGRAALGAARALRRRSLALAAATLVLASPGGVPPPGVLALALGVGVGLVAHEAGHAALLTGVGAALVVHGLRTFVIHPPLAPGRRGAVAAGGPGAAAAVGVGMVVIGWLTGLPELALFGCAPAAHAAGLTVATPDGRTACGL
jgi:hypothetical protein